MPDHEFKDLEAELKQKISGEVRFDAGSRALYATDASNYRQVPIGVVIPKDQNDIIATVALCKKYQAPVLCRGGGTSLAGQCCNVAVVIDMSKYVNEIVKLDPENKTAVVQPGLVLDTLRDAAEQYHLTFGPDPATHAYCTLGGMMGNNACGVHSVMSGKTDDNVLELDILTYDGLRMKVGRTSKEELEKYIQEGGRKGEIYGKLKSFSEKYSSLIEEKYPKIPRCVSGYNLTWLLEKNGFDLAKALIGSESTCVTILEAKVKLVYSPPARSLLVLGYPDIYTACDHIMEILEHQPIALEGMDIDLVEDMKKKKIYSQDLKHLPKGEGWLFVEFGAESKNESNNQAKILMEALKKKPSSPSMKLYDDPLVEKILWKIRESGLGASTGMPNEKDTWPGWEDSAVPPEKLGDYLRELRKLLIKYDYKCALYGHFGQGCVHTRIDFDLYTAEGLQNYRSFLHDAAHLVVSFGGSLSGEHGDGQSRAALLPIMFGPELINAFREFKLIWDPTWKMNPGKITNPYQPTDNLRISPQYDPPVLKTHFKFRENNGDGFARATTLCVGVGKCRRYNEGTMCPSYMVTKEEKHSTRGRARLLFEMLQGSVIGKKGWKDDSVKEALDLCLACKGCKGECPMTVDMATYKAEFLSHYYKGRMRPRSAYAFGLISWWAKIASTMPRFVNFLTHAPGLSTLAKWMSGTAQERSIPRFCRQTFRDWYAKREAQQQKSQKMKVILWVDTFNNYFHSEVAQATVEVLEYLGFEVMLPKASLCCGRPLYDYGMLERAKKLLKKILSTMKEEIENGTPIIGLEPSCVAVFRDELVNLFPSDLDAQRLKGQTYLFSEFLVKYAKDFRFKPLNRKALVQGHCHHKSILKFDDEKEILQRLGLDFKILDSGCCGMAGGFGFEKHHYNVSMQVGERVLIPAIRNSSSDTLIIANGFSCREQIIQATGREVLHLAQVVRMATNSD
jgi:FAD/FMN-containing dehydrogenase/Fe-S oxidoreductase